MSKDKWTTTPPKVEGWYWANWGGDIRIVEVLKDVPTGKLHVWMTGWEEYFLLENFTHWFGPIPEPKPPKSKSNE